MNNLHLIFIQPSHCEINQKKLSNIIQKANRNLSVTIKEISPPLSLSRENGWVSDDAFFTLAKSQTRSPNSIIIIVTSLNIQNNWFVRRNDMNDSNGDFIDRAPVLIVSLKDLDLLAKDFQLSLERITATTILVATYTSALLSRGANYFSDIYPDTLAIEKSVFNFCEDKELIRNSLMAGTIGPRIKYLMERQGFSKDEIDAIESSFQSVTKDYRTKIERYGRNNPIAVAIAFLLLGWILSSLVSPNDLWKLRGDSKSQIEQISK